MLLYSVWMTWRNWSLKFRSHHARRTPIWRACCWRVFMRHPRQNSFQLTGAYRSGAHSVSDSGSKNHPPSDFWIQHGVWQIIVGLKMVGGRDCEGWFEFEAFQTIDASPSTSGEFLEQPLTSTEAMVDWLAKSQVTCTSQGMDGAILVCESRLFPRSTWDPGTRRNLQAGPLGRLTPFLERSGWTYSIVLAALP